MTEFVEPCLYYNAQSELMNIDKRHITKHDGFLSFFFFIMYLYTSMPALQFTMMSNSNIFFLLFGYGFIFMTALKYKVNFFNRKLIVILMIVSVWSIAQLFIHRSFFKLSPFIILEIAYSYVIIKVFGYSIFKRFEDVTYILCAIALIGWGLNIFLHPLMRILSDIFGFVADGEKSTSLLLYTVNMTDSFRNCGFSWEPGRTSCMACVGIMLYLMRTKCNFKTVRFWVMTACLISTLSTTGFSTYIVILVLCFKSFRRIGAVHIIFLSLLIVGVMSLPFMGEKIESLLEGGNSQGMESISNSLNWEATNEGSDRDYYVPQRFQGLMFSVINLLNTNFIIGDGRDFTQFYINRVNNWNVKTSEGILEPVVQYGVLLAFFMYYYLFMVSKRISNMYNIKNKWIFFVTFMMISISYNFWETPLFMAMWMMPFFTNNNYAVKRPTTIPVYSDRVLQQ